ncbi:uncharacterized protein HMPREF1541_09989 [Cyphellophora europaea CBS 101466]|uniref:C2H2-type domain-containing protein n=1 Tax=Cyphellophora europaea (strain CBS 101466) TaxID=1220924 RepID=W2S8V9_CYPE1|nr:uncharacterized protein HMPREF1541_09989 [Cyphellophora europaea CBS 101466]ETN45112.1 hypothetical protein HMPREF1541_09989 [Cyphellophora europaea CBS 101466]
MEPPALTDPPAEEVFECTYSHCNERFSTLKEMKRHKVHADMHYYCKKCDKDFSSDLKHIMHRVITDDKHITCPECGSDFKSKGGLARHMELMHPHKQDIPCLACGKRLSKPSLIVKHVEAGECKIAPEEWRLERAQRAVAKEAFLQQYNQGAGSCVSGESAASNPNGGVSILDQAAPEARRAEAVTPEDVKPTLLSLDEMAEKLPMSEAQTRVGGSQISQFSSQSWDDKPKSSDVGSANNSHQPATFKLLDFYCPIREIYICTGANCGQTFKEEAEFLAHLSGPAHVGGRVTCQFCLKTFANNYALLSHMESSSRKCAMRNSVNYNQVLRDVTAGLVGTGGHFSDGQVKYIFPKDEGWKA